MFTIKHIELDGYESLNQAPRISYDNKERTVSLWERDGSSLLGTTNVYGSGIVYVMNESGKTVASYRLTSSSVPQ